MLARAAPAEVRGYLPPFLTPSLQAGGLQVWTGSIAKTAPATKVAYNEKTKILEVKDFSKEPVTLRDVRLETSERTAFARYYQPAPPK